MEEAGDAAGFISPEHSLVPYAILVMMGVSRIVFYIPGGFKYAVPK